MITSSLNFFSSIETQLFDDVTFSFSAALEEDPVSEFVWFSSEEVLSGKYCDVMITFRKIVAKTKSIHDYFM